MYVGGDRSPASVWPRAARRATACNQGAAVGDQQLGEERELLPRRLEQCERGGEPRPRLRVRLSVALGNQQPERRCVGEVRVRGRFEYRAGRGGEGPGEHLMRDDRRSDRGNTLSRRRSFDDGGPIPGHERLRPAW